MPVLYYDSFSATHTKKAKSFFCGYKCDPSPPPSAYGYGRVSESTADLTAVLSAECAPNSVFTGNAASDKTGFVLSRAHVEADLRSVIAKHS